MVVNKAYYLCKPLLPWNLRTGLRRLRAVYKRSACAAVWPIDEKAGEIPNGWPGWPEGKRFAVVLTHDVESQRGLDRIERLMRLETEQGFRSAFNLVPEGDYWAPDALRVAIGRAGFEVGIHGLKHDGKLYSSHAEFSRQAARIREYARNWRTSGFRSPFMHHNLEWIHELDMEYDASTFDTDPFEPQPDGVGTIFPFWVSNSSGDGYVELPYTLVQDYSLFVILREKTIDIWKRKLDWVADRGGMVLINTHPDYMCFDGRCGRDEYSVSHYVELVSYIRERYQGMFWHALPRDVARYYRTTVHEEPASLKAKNIAVSAKSQL
jgi:peptidoglycan/xylan/chitin deacetylase (PgdA/CDA1 family)